MSEPDIAPAEPRPAILASRGRRITLGIVLGAALIGIWGITRFGPMNAAPELPDPTPQAPAAAISGDRDPVITVTAEQYEKAATTFLTNYNTWDWRTTPGDFQDRMLPLVNPTSPSRSSMLMRPELTDPADDCLAPKQCQFTAQTSFVSSETRDDNVWAGLFTVVVTRTVDGVPDPEVEELLWEVQADPNRPEPTYARVLYEAD